MCPNRLRRPIALRPNPVADSTWSDESKKAPKSPGRFRGHLAQLLVSALVLSTMAAFH